MIYQPNYNRAKITQLVIFICSSFIGRSVQHNSFKIVGLFHEENSQSEMAFRYGIDRFNMFKAEIRYNATVGQVSTFDTFQTSKAVCSLTSEDTGVIAVFGPESLTTASMVQSICANLNIPHIQTNWKPTTTQPSTILNMYPDPDLLSQALATLVRHMNWKSYTILYENNDGLIRLQEVFKIAQSDSMPVTLRQLPADLDYRSLFKELKYIKESRIIIDCARESILNILQQAKEVEMVDYYHSYIFTNLDAHLVDFKSLHTTANITLVRIVDPDNPSLNYIIRDWEMGELTRNRHRNIVPNEITTEAALMADAISHFTSAFQELYASAEIASDSLSCAEKKTWDSGLGIINYLKVRPMVNAITGNVRFDELGHRADFTVQIAEVIEGAIATAGTWTPAQPNSIDFLRSADEQMQQIVQSLQKTTVIVSSRIGPPYLMRKEPSENEGAVLEGNGQFEGYSLDLIDEVSKVLNFTYRFELAADGKYGNYVPENDTWNGLIKDLIDRKAHLAICDLTITHQRREVVDFSLPFMTLGVSILYSKSKPSDRNIFAFMEPLDNTVWIYIMSSYVTVTLIMFAVTRMAPGDWEDPNPMNNEEPEELENIWTFKNCLWLVLGSTMSQGCDMLPKGISSRMAASMWWFFILIISSSYTANLAAFLTMDKMAPSIDSAEALSKQTKIKYGTVNGGSTQTFFSESNFTTYQRMWTQMETARPSVFEKSNADGVKRVLTTKNQGYAFLMESSSIDYEIERNCELKQVGGRMDSKGYGIAMPVNSPYRSAINKAVLQLQEEGKLAILKNKWWKEMHGGGACDDAVSDGGSDAELKLANVGGVFLVLGISVAVAFIFCIIDLCWNVHKITVKQHLTYGEALKKELVFAIKVWKTEKPVVKDTSGGSIDNVSMSVKLNSSKSQNTLDDISGTNNKKNGLKKIVRESVKSDSSCTQTI